MNSKKFLEQAVEQAAVALETGNYPCGAVIVDGAGNIIASAYAENSSQHDVSAHAEIQCLRKMDSKELLDETKKYYLYSSAEPCGGCSFFIARTNIRHVCWALTDPQKPGFDDIRKDGALSKSYFTDIEVVAEPYDDLKGKSASLWRQYYEGLDKPEKAKLY